MTGPRSKHRDIRGNPLLKEHIHDPYRTLQKLDQGTGCPECGALFMDGRWIWPRAGENAEHSALCPACRRVRDHYPAGEVRLSGAFLDAHRDEIIAKVRKLGDDERHAHPLHRVIDIDEQGAVTVVTTTDIHLPHLIGHALKDAWAGELETHYDADGYFARITWERND